MSKFERKVQRAKLKTTTQSAKRIYLNSKFQFPNHN